MMAPALAPSRLRVVVSVALDILVLAAFVTIVISATPVIEANANIRTAIGVPVNLLYLSLPVAVLLVIPALILSALWPPKRGHGEETASLPPTGER